MSDQGQIYPESPGVTGELLPLNRAPDGSLRPAVPGFVHDIINTGYNALTGPGEIATGKTPTGAPAHPNALAVAQDMTAGLLGAGGLVSAPENSMLSFGGKLASTSNWAERAWAIAAEKAGASPRSIMDQTGWFRDADGNWKFEISNEGADLAPKLKGLNDPFNYLSRQQNRGMTHTLQDVYSDPALFDAYPQLKNIKIQTLPQGGGYFDSSTNTIGMGAGAARNRNEFISTILHETQHAIQDIEDFATGGSPRQFDSPEWENENVELGKVYSEKRRAAQDAAQVAGYSPSDAAAAVTAAYQKAGTEIFRSPSFLAQTGETWSPKLAHPVTQLPEVQDAIETAKATAAHIADSRSPMQRYLSLAGEVEARNVEERWLQGLSGDRSAMPWETEGYWKAMQDVRFDRTPTQQESFRGFHGTPHEFQPTEDNPFGEFSDEKIGSGEGAQVYGHGHYVAGARATAEDYQKKLATGTSGNLLHLEIKPDEEELLDWDKPLDGQLPKVQEAIRPKLEAALNKQYDALAAYKGPAMGLSSDGRHLARMLQASGPDGIPDVANGLTGEEVYRVLGRENAEGKGPFDEKERQINASTWLKGNGIPGIKYLDQFSRRPTDPATYEGKLSPLQQQGLDIVNRSGQGNKWERGEAADYHQRLLGNYTQTLENSPEQYMSGGRAGLENNIAALKSLDPSKLVGPTRTRNYVIFDPKNIRIVGKNNQMLGMEEAEGNPFK